MDTPNLRAMLLIVSPVCTVYAKGVGLGRGFSAVTNPPGVWIVPTGRIGLGVEVAYGIRSTDESVDSAGRDAQAIKIRGREVHKKKVKSVRCMRRL
jgi:hypothetical protein